MITLRPYQQEAVAAVRKEWTEGRKRTLLVMATGLGKTVCFASVLKDSLKAGEKALVLAHRGELLFQAADKIRNVCNMECALEKADSRAAGSLLPITLGSVQTLVSDSRLRQYPRDYFSKIIVDEAHHTMSDSYMKIMEYFDSAYVLGCTATATRSDKRDLSSFYNSVAYEYSLYKAVKNGYLCPIKAELIPLKLDISSVKISNGDYSANELGNALDPYLPLIAEEMKEKCRGRKTVVFLPLIETSLKFLKILKELGMNAEEVNGSSPDREEKLKRFENGRTDILLNSMLLTEGWDCPCVDCIVVLRPTRIRGLLIQMLGRGTRLFPGKKELLVLDFLWLTEKHDLCKPSSILGASKEVAEKIDKQIESGKMVDLIEAEEQAERDVVREREEALAEELRAMRSRKRRLVDPLQFAVSVDDEVLMNYEPSFAWEMEPPSEKQIQFLERRGIAPDTVRNKGYANMIIERLQRRLDMNLTTPKQIRLLEKYGFERVGTWSMQDAVKVITRLAELKWVLPRGFDPKGYVPKSISGGNL